MGKEGGLWCREDLKGKTIEDVRFCPHGCQVLIVFTDGTTAYIPAVADPEIIIVKNFFTT